MDTTCGSWVGLVWRGPHSVHCVNKGVVWLVVCTSQFASRQCSKAWMLSCWNREKRVFLHWVVWLEVIGQRSWISRDGRTAAVCQSRVRVCVLCALYLLWVLFS